MPPSAPPRRVVGRRGDLSEIVLDAEFQALNLPLAPEEEVQIQRTFLVDGCREPLVVWRHRGRLVLLTGYAVFPLLKRHRVPFLVIEKEFAYRDDARLYIVKDLLAHKHLGELAMSYLRGLFYHKEKQPQGGDRKSADAVKGWEGARRTAAALGEMFGVSPRTIERDRALANAVETIAAECGEDIKARLLARGGPLRRAALLEFA